MIPYPDLVAALRHWRARNGLANVGADLGPPPSLVMKPPPGPGAPLVAPTRAAPPMAPPGARTIEVEDELEADVIESEEIYESDGDDFAMKFADGPALPSEPTVQGVPPGPPSFATDPGLADHGEPLAADLDPYAAGTATFDDDFAAEASPAPQREGTRPGIGSLDADTDDLPASPGPNVPPPPGKKKKR